MKVIRFFSISHFFISLSVLLFCFLIPPYLANAAIPIFNGACCFDDGSCAEETEDDCGAQGGSYSGDTTECSSTQCPLLLCPADGDCCESHGTPGCDDCNCQQAVCAINSSCCDDSWGGITNGDCESIANEICLVCNPPPTGACCFSDGSCAEETEDDCAAAGGSYNGDGTLCSSTECSQPPPLSLRSKKLYSWSGSVSVVF